MLLRLSAAAASLTLLGIGIPDARLTRSQGGDASLVGQWKGEMTTAGATATTTINFFANRTYSRRVVVVTRFGWTLDGNFLLLAPEIVGANNVVDYGKPLVAQLNIYGDTLVAKWGDESLTLRRVTVPIDESPLAGRWEGKSGDDGITQDFTSDGKLIVTTTLMREAGRYTVRGKTIMWEEQIPYPAKRRSKFKLENGKLIVDTSARAVPIEFTRVQADSARS